ncbi:hypothetical protein ABBQ38_011794 [Trebouxia sp. C0009 RCD-2024]
MEKLLQDVANVERLGDDLASTYAKLQQCSSNIKELMAALDALQCMHNKSELVWVQRPGGLVIGLSHNHALHVLQEDLALCKIRQQQLQQQQKSLTEVLGEQGDVRQSLLSAVV